MSLSIKSEMEKNMGNVMGKLFQEHKRKERAGAQPNLESWAETAAPTRNHHRKVAQFLKTGVRRPAGLSSSRKGTGIYINQLLITQQGHFPGSRSPFLCHKTIATCNWRYWERTRGSKKDLLNLICSPKQSGQTQVEKLHCWQLWICKYWM